MNQSIQGEMMKTIFGLCLLGLFSLTSLNTFAVGASCKAINSRTGQVFFANAGAQWPGKAIKKASNKAIWKCHSRSQGWSNFCFIKRCTNNVYY